MKTPRIVAAGIFLFLVIAVDFTSRFMSFLADSVLVVGAIFMIYPILFNKK